MKRLFFIPVLCCLLVSFTTRSHAELFGDYVGYKECAKCHTEIVEGWKTTPHAHAFATLKEQGAEKQSTPGCVCCHVVAMDDDGGFMDLELTPELTNVQCESCHGSGLAHSQSGDPADLTSQPNEKLCRTCHTKGQDKNFNYKVKSRFVHGKATDK